MKKFLVAVVLAVVSLFSVSGAGVCEAAAEKATVGFVRLDAAFNAYPGLAEVHKAIQNEQKILQSEFDSKAESLDEAGRAKLQHELNIKLAQKQAEMMQPVQKKIFEAIATVAKNKGIAQVVKFEAMLFGGVDLTNDVIEIIKK